MYVYPATYLTNGSSEQVSATDEQDTIANSDALKQRAAAIEHIQNKISRTKEQIRAEQTTRDGELPTPCIVQEKIHNDYYISRQCQ